MDTIFRWSRDFPGHGLLPSHIERNHYKLVEIVEVVEYCIGREFDEDVKSFEQEYGRLPDSRERPFILPPLYSYTSERKSRFINCVKEKTRTLLEPDDNTRVNISFRLWAGCLMTAKEISDKTQTGRNTSNLRRRKFENIINPYSHADIILGLGKEYRHFSNVKLDKEMMSSSMEFLLIRQYWMLGMNLRTLGFTVGRNVIDTSKHILGDLLSQIWCAFHRMKTLLKSSPIAKEIVRKNLFQSLVFVSYREEVF